MTCNNGGGDAASSIHRLSADLLDDYGGSSSSRKGIVDNHNNKRVHQSLANASSVASFASRASRHKSTHAPPTSAASSSHHAIIHTYRCLHWDTNYSVEKGKLYLTYNELVFKCHKKRRLKFHVLYPQIAKVAKIDNYKGTVHSVLVVVMRDTSSFVLFQFGVPRALVKMRIMELKDQNEWTRAMRGEPIDEYDEGGDGDDESVMRFERVIRPLASLAKRVRDRIVDEDTLTLDGATFTQEGSVKTMSDANERPLATSAPVRTSEALLAAVGTPCTSAAATTTAVAESSGEQVVSTECQPVSASGVARPRILSLVPATAAEVSTSAIVSAIAPSKSLLAVPDAATTTVAATTGVDRSASAEPASPRTSPRKQKRSQSISTPLMAMVGQLINATAGGGSSSNERASESTAATTPSGGGGDTFAGDLGHKGVKLPSSASASLPSRRNLRKMKKSQERAKKSQEEQLAVSKHSGRKASKVSISIDKGQLQSPSTPTTPTEQQQQQQRRLSTPTTHDDWQQQQQQRGSSKRTPASPSIEPLLEVENEEEDDGGDDTRMPLSTPPTTTPTSSMQPPLGVVPIGANELDELLRPREPRVLDADSCSCSLSSAFAAPTTTTTTASSSSSSSTWLLAIMMLSLAFFSFITVLNFQRIARLELDMDLHSVTSASSSSSSSTSVSSQSWLSSFFS